MRGYSGVVGFSKGLRMKDSIESIFLKQNFVEYVTKGDKKYCLHFEANSVNALIVDEVNGIQPTSLENLFDLINQAI